MKVLRTRSGRGNVSCTVSQLQKKQPMSRTCIMLSMLSNLRPPTPREWKSPDPFLLQACRVRRAPEAPEKSGELEGSAHLSTSHKLPLTLLKICWRNPFRGYLLFAVRSHLVSRGTSHSGSKVRIAHRLFSTGSEPNSRQRKQQQSSGRFD